MSKQLALRTWATPLTIGTFTLMAVTGIMMFFDLVPGYITFAHEWASWIFVIGAGAHIVINYRSFLRHLKSGFGRANVAFFVAILVISTLSFGRITAPQLKWPIADALVDAPLPVLASLTRTEQGALIERLKVHGVVATPNQTIRQLSATNEIDELHILGLIILRK